MKIREKRVAMFAAFCLLAGAASAATGKSAAFPVDLREGDRVSAGTEELTFSNLWDGGDGAMVTIAENGAVVADGLSGEGTRSWSVQKTGEYTLTHTTYTNGVAGKVETATFVVPGPELTFEYDGGPFVGGKVTINGNIDGWTIYYTLDGSTPTTKSLKYTGPFTLSSAANLKAYAVSDSGMSTPLIENNYAVVERARIENVRARQRWPWNGKVDIDCKVSGIYETIYRVKFAIFAVDRDLGNTNKVSHFWVVRDGVNSNDRVVHTNGEYRLVWDARADLGEAIYSNMVVSVSLVEDVHNGVQLWENGPYWAETNIGAEKPEDYGYYFWWGDTVGYKWENGAWAASDGSSSNFSFDGGNAPTDNKTSETLLNEGWITANDVLAPEHDVAQVQWGDTWRIPTWQELSDLNNNCDWTWATMNGINGFVVRGRDEYDRASIFIPAAGGGDGVSISNVDSYGDYWSSTPEPSAYAISAKSWTLSFGSDYHYELRAHRYIGHPIRPVQSDTQTHVTSVGHFADSTPFSVDMREGPRESLGDETLTYSSQWDGGDSATVTIAQDGAALAEGLSGEGERAWSVTRNGTYVLTHTTYTNGVAGKVETATFVVTGKDVPFAAGDVTVAGFAGKYDGASHGIGVTVKDGIEDVALKYAASQTGEPPVLPESWSNELPTITDVGSMTVWCEIAAPGYITQTNSATVVISPREVTLTSGSASKAYDGTPLVCHSVTTNGDGFVAGEGVDFSFTGSQTIVGSSKNTFDYTFKPGTQAGNYTITKTEGNLTVNAATIYDEPGPGPIPVGGLSKFDATYVYDGEGHTINTQALYAVKLVGSTPSFSFSLDGETGWQNDPFVYTNVGEYVMWYRISAPNYADYKHQAKVTIQPLVLTVTFDANGGSCPMASKTVTHGATYGTLPTPTWTGHIFAGWYTAASGGDEVKDSTAVSIMAPQTLYAHWVSVTGVSAKQRYPWNGLVDITVAFEGESNDVAKVDCSFIATNSATKAELSVASITRKGADSGKDNAWSRQFVWNAGADVGAVKIDDVALTVAAAISIEGGVQLWENGPYWAECNVGATKPEDVGYYFWWGDTIGYKYMDGIWTGDTHYSRVLWASSEGGTLNWGESPFALSKCETNGKSELVLQNLGYLDSTGCLADSRDAAVMHLDGAWRMPMAQDVKGLVANCTTIWTVSNGVYGVLVSGKGRYELESIFLPASGFGMAENDPWGACLYYPGQCGYYWSASPCSDDYNSSSCIEFDSDGVWVGSGKRPYGYSIRPLQRLSSAGSLGGCVSVVFPLDCRTGDRVSAGTEELTFSNLWDGDAEATVTIAQDGAAIFTGLSGEGVKTWSVDRNGRYELTHTTYTNGVKGKVETVVFVVEGKEVPVSELTIDWGQKSFVYDGQPKEPVITVKDRETTLTKGAHYFVEYKDNVNVGTAKAIVKGIEPYVEEVTNTFTITKGTLPDDVDPDPIKPDPTKPDGPYSAFDYVGVYDGEGHTIDTNGLTVAYRAAVGAGFAVSYAVGENGGAGVPALPATGWGAVAPVFTNAATNVVWYKVSSANYEDIVHPAKVAIVSRAITIASVDGTWTYDTVAHALREVKVTGEGEEEEFEFPEGEGIEVDEASFPTITDVGEKDNAFEWAFAEGTLAGNYAVTVKYGKLKVNARTIGDDDKNWDIRLDKAPMYNGEVQSAPIIQVCYVKPDGNLDYIPYELAGNTATDAGNYKVKISGKGNYTGTVEKDWAIMPRNLKMTSGTEEWMYDGETHSNDTVAVTGDGFVEGEGATYEGFPLVTHFADAAEPVENAFTYKLNENTKAKNYEIETKTGTVRMTKRPISLTAPTKSKTYDGTPLTFDESEIKIEFAGVVGGDVLGAPQPTQNETAFDEGCGAPGGRALPEGEYFTFSNFASITEAGQVAATFTIADGTALMADYDITVTPGATLTVQKIATEITVTAKNGTWVYDGEEHKLHEYEATNLGTLVGGDKLEVSFSADSVVTTPLDGGNQDGVVENAITSVKVMRGDVDVSDNYTLAWCPGALTVTKRPVTLTSKGASKSYDGTALTKHEVEVGGDGFVGEDGATYTFSGSQLDKGKSKNAFEYSLKSGTNAAYYEITKVEGELEVFPADISAGTEEDWEIVLGPALTYNGIAQVQTITSVKYKGLDLDYTVTDNQRIDAGDYELVLTGQGNFTGTKRVAWKLNPKPITITAKSVTRPYDGNVLMSWNSTTEGMVPGEDAGAMTCTGNIKDVGSCGNAIAQLWWADNTKPSNYSVTKVAGTLTITPRPVTVTSKNITKPFDGTPLTLQSSDIYTEGIVIGEKFYYTDLASRTEAGQTSATFKIITLDNTKLTNYAITPVYGTITITKSATEIGVTARSKSWPYDATTHKLHEYDATNLNILQPGEELVVTFKEASKVTTPKDGPAEDGKVANEIESIRVVKNGTQDVTDNYTVTPYPGLLTVTKRPVTVTVEGETVSATYDGEEHTASGYDIATEDELYDIAAKTSFGGTDEVTRTDAGKSEMGLKPSDFTNSDEYFDVTYAVTDGWVSVVPADISAGEEDFVLTLGANPKYNGTVQTIPVTAVTYKELPVTYTLAGENATHAGTYTLTVKANGNFKGERSTTWKILKRQVKMTSGSASRAYNGQPLVNGDVTVSGDGFIGIEGATYSVTGSQTLAGSSKNAFTYALKAGTQEGDYDIEKVEGDLVVTKAKYPGNIQWNVAADAATWMYDGQQHGVTLTGVPSGVTPHLTGNAAKDVGEYTASVTFDFDAANYEPPKVPAPLKWSITARPLSLQTVNAEKPYDGFPLTVDKANITPGLSGYAEGECFDYFDLASITEVGETPATFKYRDSASAKVSNYAVSVVGGATLKVTVGGDQISVTARDGTWAYDATEHRKMEWDIVNGDKLLAGHEFRIKIDETKSVVKTPEDGPEHNGIVSNVFEYVKIVETETGADKTKNYNLFVCEGALQITNRVICSEELRVNSEEFTEKIEKTYDGEPTNVTVTAELLQPATILYAVGGDVPGAPQTGWQEEPLVFTDAGEYVVWYTVAAQYYNTYTNKVEVKIDKRPITLTSPTKSKPFDGTALTFDGGEIEVSLTAPVAEDGDGTVLPDGESLVFSDFASITDAGRVDATFEYAAGAGTSLDNYEVTVKKGTLTVNASAEEITVTAKSGSWPYDGEDHVLHDCEVENEEVLQSGDELVVEYLPASKVTTPDDGEVENVITSVRVMRGGEDGEDVTRNYSIVTYTGKIKVVNATIRSEELRVKSEECVYDGEGHTISVEAVGLLTSPATVVYSATGEGAWKLDPMSVAVKNAGTHAIRYRVSAKFYNDYFGEATVKINPRPVTLLSGSATKTYDGTPLRKDEVKVKEGSLDFVDGEGVTTSCTSAQTGVGRIENGFNYEFKSGTLQDNYTIIPAFGWLEVTPGTLTVDPAKSGYNAPYDGKAHGPEVLGALSGLGFNPEACEITYALVPGDESAYSPTMPTLTDVGTQTVYVKIKAQNFEVVYAEMTVVVTEKEITDEMVQPGEDAFFFDGDAKKPTVDVQHIVDGVDICTENDYTVTYGTKADAGWWVTVTGKGNYSGTVTKIVPVLKRPVAPPVVPSRSYTGKTQKPTIPTDSRWTTVSNPGGIDVGEYSNVVLRLTNTTDYKWKGGAEDQTDITLVFKVTKGNNGWSRQPDMKGWTYGETPSEPNLGQTRYGTVKVAYRKKGAAVETEVAEKPSKPGKYIARFWADETENFIGVSTKPPYKEIEFEIVDPSGGGDVTVTTPVPVPHDWLEPYLAQFGGDYETAANAKGKNGVALWESYVAGLDPEDATSRFMAKIEMLPNGTVKITWSPDLSTAEVPRTYTTLGKATLLDKDWVPVTNANKPMMRFFKVKVEME